MLGRLSCTGMQHLLQFFPFPIMLKDAAGKGVGPGHDTIGPWDFNNIFGQGGEVVVRDVEYFGVLVGVVERVTEVIKEGLAPPAETHLDVRV